MMQRLDPSLNPEPTQNPGGGGYVNADPSGFSSPLPYPVTDIVSKSANQTVAGQNTFTNSANSFQGIFKSADGSTGTTATITFYTAPTSGAAATKLNTVTIKNGIITAWTQA